MPAAFTLALAKAGNNSPARMAMMAMTTKSSIRVKAHRDFIVEERDLLNVSSFIKYPHHFASGSGAIRRKYPFVRQTSNLLHQDPNCFAPGWLDNATLRRNGNCAFDSTPGRQGASRLRCP